MTTNKAQKTELIAGRWTVPIKKTQKAPKKPHILNEKNDCINCGMIELMAQKYEECPAMNTKQKAQHTAEWHEAKMGNDHQGLVIDQDGNNIAVTYDKANARLIAAAPELLEAVEMMHRWLDANQDKMGALAEEQATAELVCTMACALEKAKGA